MYICNAHDSYLHDAQVHHPLLFLSFSWRDSPGRWKESPSSPESQQEESKCKVVLFQNAEGWTPTHMVVRDLAVTGADVRQYLPLIGLMLRHGANFSRRGSIGDTSLHMALGMSRHSMQHRTHRLARISDNHTGIM